MRGEATPAQIAGFLVALRSRARRAEEIAGCAEAMRRTSSRCTRCGDDVVDTAGTGGDGAGTLNLSTAAALVAAAAGAGVAKHGNRAVSSASGSADVLEALGFDSSSTPRADRALDRRARLRLPVRARCITRPCGTPAPVRRELATRTVFNVLGPLTNPAGARAQVVGVFAPSSCRRSRRRAGAPRSAARVRGARRRRDRRALTRRPEPRLRGRGRARPPARDRPERTSASRAAREDLRGGTPEENAAAVRAVLAGAPGPMRDAVLLNAAVADRGGRPPRTPRTATRLAAEAIDSGAAAERLEDLSPSHARRRPRRPDGPIPRRAGRAAALGAIAEVKRRSPSAGDLRPGRRPRGAARGVRGEGAAAGLHPRRRALRRGRGRPPSRAGGDRRCRCSPRVLPRPEQPRGRPRDAGADAALLLLRDLDDAAASRLIRGGRELGLDAARRGARRGGAPRARSRSART